MSACRSCGAPVLWAVTVQGNTMPLDPEPADGGNVILTGRYATTRNGGQAPECRVEAGPALFDDGSPRYTPHWATCPDADQWRQK